jgi:hypothetical protein
VKPEEFRPRFARAAAKLASREIEFVCYDPAVLSERNVSPDDINFLSEIGLPKDEPFLGFNALTAASMAERLCFLGDPPNLYLLGEPGTGLVIAVDTSTKQVVRVRYDRDDIVFVSSSLLLLAETLCLFLEQDDSRDFLERLERLDAPAASPGAFWRELADDVQVLENL